MSTVINTPEQLFAEIDNYFLAEARLKYPIALADSHRQNEAWFSQQLSYLFSSLQEQTLLSNWEPEFPLSQALSPAEKGRLDFRVMVNHQTMYLEIKTLYLGPQGKSVVDISIYFDPNPKNGYIGLDVHKLAKVGEGYCILFVYPFPNPLRWSINVDRFASKMAAKDIEVKEIGTPDLKKYSPHLYVAKLHVISHIRNI